MANEFLLFYSEDRITLDSFVGLPRLEETAWYLR